MTQAGERANSERLRAELERTDVIASNLQGELNAAIRLLDAERARITELEEERDILLAENDAFRAGAGNSKEPCIYCGLSAEDQLRCRDGFPGCARADDQMLCRHFAAELEVLDRATAAEGERDTATRALGEVWAWIKNWDPQFIYDDEWPATAAKVLAALSKTEGKG